MKYELKKPRDKGKIFKIISEDRAISLPVLRFFKNLKSWVPVKKYSISPKKDTGIPKKYENTELKTIEQFWSEHKINEPFNFKIVR